ncbi:YheU family protein [Agaribacterium haliotis]|uniref:YheU family protein n=1 Tax=Agaribacterium haliotis TaxID=2013869 RepID=UPI000BB57AD4|nr:YheU family protein [Agaribacterium haliotis]
MIIPLESLEASTLNNILDDFIHREGTDYGEQEVSLQQKRQQLLTQLQRGDLFICYDQSSESVTLIDKSSYEASL